MFVSYICIVLRNVNIFLSIHLIIFVKTHVYINYYILFFLQLLPHLSKACRFWIRFKVIKMKNEINLIFNIVV